MARHRTLIIIATLGLASAIFGIAANVATGTLPDLLPPAWKPYLPWVAWPLALISALVLVVLPVRQYLDEYAPESQTITQEQRNRRHMIEKVRRIWITDFLDRSLYRALYRETLISLDLLYIYGPYTNPLSDV